MSRESAGLKQVFNFKCVIDVVTYVLTCVLLLVFTKIKGVPPYDTFIFLIIVTAVNAIVFIFTRHWLLTTVKSNYSYNFYSINKESRQHENIRNKLK